MTEDPAELEAVQQRLREIQSRKRGRIRWNISKHTAELAIEALGIPAKPKSRSGKQRRRKRSKRLL